MAKPPKKKNLRRKKKSHRDFTAKSPSFRFEHLEPRQMFSVAPLHGIEPLTQDVYEKPLVDKHLEAAYSPSVQESQTEPEQIAPPLIEPTKQVQETPPPLEQTETPLVEPTDSSQEPPPPPSPSSPWTPLIYAGADRTISSSETTNLTAEVITNNPQDKTVTWSQASGPGTATFDDATAEITTAMFSVPGTYELDLTVTNHGITATDRVVVHVEESSLTLWEEQMLQYGLQHGEALRAAIENGTGNFGVTYYDAARVFYNIADYTGDDSWNEYAELAAIIYRDEFVFPQNGVVPGYWHFTRGLTMHYERTNDEQSREAVLLLSEKASYATDSTPLEWTTSAIRSREVAYAINSYLDAERLGAPRRDRLQLLVEQALGHLDQWFIEENDPAYAPFMFSLTSEALINYYNQVEQDPRIIEALEMGANYTWQNAWVPEDESFIYRADDPAYTANDLNLLIAPVYEWLHQRTGNSQYRDQADQIFTGGVTGAWLNGSKQFNQNFRWSFDYIAMRNTQPSAAELSINSSQFAELEAAPLVVAPLSAYYAEVKSYQATNYAIQETREPELSTELVGNITVIAKPLPLISSSIKSLDEDTHGEIFADSGTVETMHDTSAYDWLDSLFIEENSLFSIWR